MIETVLELFMTYFSGEGNGGGAYFEFRIQQGRLIEGGRLIEEIRYIQSLIMIFKCMNNHGPTYINDFFKVKVVKYNLRGSSTRLEQPRFNLKWCHKSFSYVASTLWNKLQVKVREFKDITTFKGSLRAHTFL